VNIAIWKAPHSTGDGSFMKSQLAAFTKSHPNIATTYTVTPWATWTPVYTAAYKGSNPPDVAYMPYDFFTQFAAFGALQPLNKLAGVNLAPWKPLFATPVWDEFVYKGNFYALPWLSDDVIFVWNKAQFRKAGLNPNVPPATWADVMQYAKQLTVRSNGKTTQWGYGIMDNTQNFMLNFMPIPMSNYGGTLATLDSRRWIADGPGYITGLQTQADMMQKDKTAPPFGVFVGSDLNTAFLEGKVSMYLSYSDFLLPLLPHYPGFELGISTTPHGPVNRYTVGGSGGWFIADKSPNKAEAWEVVQYLSNKALTKAYTEMVKFYPATSDWNPYAPGTQMYTFLRAQGVPMPLPQLPFDFWTISMPLVEQAISGQLSVKQALTTAAEEINSRIQALR
jgi:ABC-type glycerol-3-phosphate transport system substrate-binding protein